MKASPADDGGAPHASYSRERRAPDPRRHFVVTVADSEEDLYP